MAKIKVTIMNFHGLFSHLEAMLENVSTTPSSFYLLNRWNWSDDDTFSATFAGQDYIKYASSTFSFEMEHNDPQEMIDAWHKFIKETEAIADTINNNCADGVQWFLNKFAYIPNPRKLAAPVSVNHLIFGIFLPSFFPVNITLPGRIMDNAKFHINARQQSAHPTFLSSLSLQIAIVIAALAIVSSIAGIIAASLFMTGGISAIPIVGCIITGGLSTYGLFKAVNRLAAWKIANSPSIPKADASSKSLTLSFA